MSLVELHPEELLDREACGTLTPSEQEFLDVHLARCASCRVERRARNDFAAELSADDGHLDVALLVSHALRAANTVEPPAEAPVEPPIVAPPVRRTRRPGRAVTVLLVAAAATMCAGVAAAAWSGLVRPLSLIAPPAASSPAPVAAPSTPANARKSPSSRVAVAPPADETADEAVPAAPGPSIEAPATPAAPALAPPSATIEASAHATSAPHEAASAPTSGLVPSAPATEGHQAGHQAGPRSAAAGSRVAGSQGAGSQGAGSTAPGAAQPSEAPRQTAAALFTEANDALRADNKGRAQGLYRELLHLYPTSPEARVSRATLGRLLLEQGEGAAALRTFDESLSTGAGAMAEEVMVGRALSFQRLGDARGEVSAWLALLSTHPGSIHAERARARLAVLSAR